MQIKDSIKKSEHLIQMLQIRQQQEGYLSEQVMKEIAKTMGIAESHVFAVASFYTQFRFKPIGRNLILVCRGTACHVRGAVRILRQIKEILGLKDDEDTTADMEYTVQTVACIGCCGLSPCMMINGKVEAKLTVKRLRTIFADYIEKRRHLDI
jgi:NADH:ubiquinone oxidoreductase subunit E